MEKGGEMTTGANILAGIKIGFFIGFFVGAAFPMVLWFKWERDKKKEEK
jgi:hypothetical protein